MKAAFFILPVVLLLSACDDQPSSGQAENAIEVPPPVPDQSGIPGFTWQGKPIDPVCLNAGSNPDQGDEVDLATCTGSAGKDAWTQPQDGLETFDDGAIGYTFKCEGGCMRAPFVSYKNLGMAGGHHVIEVRESGGGTGVFSDVRLMDVRDGKLITVKVLGGGDRCNGGIADAHVENGKVFFAQNLTPFDMIDISGSKAGFKAYDDIQACAACCVAEANFENDKMVSVTLTQDPKEIVSEDLGPKDACFFGTYNETYFAGTITLDDAALKVFGQKIDQRCGDLAGKELPPTVPSGAKPGDVD